MEDLKEALARSESARLKLEEENRLLKGRLEQGAKLLSCSQGRL